MVLDENIQEKQAADSASKTPLGKLLNSELKERIDKAVSTLSAKQQIAFDLRYKGGLNSAEIADLMKISVSAVKVHLNRALQVLRRKLKSEKVL
jgi:RNA polymerase sigma-70 factor (ECF subfamily)